jgi:hypothetical protein
MATSIFKTPQVHIIVKMAYAKDFECETLYAKYTFKAGYNWSLVAGSEIGETFQAGVDYTLHAPLEQPIDLNYAAKSVRGWPKMMVEVWGVDSSKKSHLCGYGVMTIPVQSGHHKITIHCWRPVTSYSDKVLGTYPELEHKDILLSSQNRYGLKSESAGTVHVEVDVILKDFQLHGVWAKE